MNEQQKGQIYCIKNKINDKMYVGQTTKYRKAGKYIRKFGYQKRFIEHIQQSTKKKASLIGRAILEIGTEHFYVELLEECEEHLLDDRERFWIDQLGTLSPNGYNALYGAPYATSTDIKRKISEGMKAFFRDDAIKKVYSEAHQNKFKDIVDGSIEKIEVRPIKQNGQNKIVYMYVQLHGGKRIRRRYGGIHESFDDAYNRCIRDANELAKGQSEKIQLDCTRYNICSNEFSNTISNIELRLHNMQGHEMVAVYVSSMEDTSTKYKKRYVFGGKTIALQDAYKNAVEFVNKIKDKDTIVYIRENLNVATLSN